MLKSTIELDGQWQFREYPAAARRMRDLEQGGWHDCTVPCSIYMALTDAGLINESDLYRYPERLGWVSEKHWIFKKEFDLDGNFFEGRGVELILEGLDTAGQVWLNEKLLGRTDNMFVEQRFDVSRLVRAGRNTILVKLASAIEHAGGLMARYGKLGETYFGDSRRVYIRKGQYQFGSFLGPALAGCGIYRPVRLESSGDARIMDVHIRTIDCNEHYADVRASVSIERRSDAETAKPLRCKIDLSGGGVQLSQEVKLFGPQRQATAVFRIERPILWWPRGYGVPHLYRLNAELYEDGGLLDAFEEPFGIRSVHLVRNKDQYGQSFEFEVNGRTIWARGCNWVPLTLFAGSQRCGDYSDRLRDMAGANVNMLRVWGGGVYEDEIFYRQCDRLGIMVWQDFMFASAYYPDRQWFIRQVQTEVSAVVTRIRNHASLVLWCGSSDTGQLHYQGSLGRGRKFYGKELYHRLLPQWLGELDPDRDYIPTTPFSQEGAKEPNEPDSGTFHFRQRGDDWSPFVYFRRHRKVPRFVAEMGMQSLPGVETLNCICRREELAPGDRAMERHNYQPDGNRLLAAGAAELFAPAGGINEYTSQTQLVQARAMKSAVEFLRAQNRVNAGVLLWTANDYWPGIGCSMLDYFGRPKALYYYARRFFAPVVICLLPKEDSRSDGEFLDAGQIVVVNDSPRPITGLLICRCVELTGDIADQTQFPVTAGPYSRCGPFSIPRGIASPRNPQRCTLETLLEGQDGILSKNSFVYLPDKYIQWPRLELDAEFTRTGENRLNIALESKGFVKDLEIIPNAAGRVSDTFLDVYPGRKYEITVDFAGQVIPATPVTFGSAPCGFMGVIES